MISVQFRQFLVCFSLLTVPPCPAICKSGGHVPPTCPMESAILPPRPDPTEATPVLGPRHQYPLGSPALPLFLFYEMVPGGWGGLQDGPGKFWRGGPYLTAT